VSPRAVLDPLPRLSRLVRHDRGARVACTPSNPWRRAGLGFVPRRRAVPSHQAPPRAAAPRARSASRRGREGGVMRHPLAALRAPAALGSQSTIAPGPLRGYPPIVTHLTWSTRASPRTVTITAAAALSRFQQPAGQPPGRRFPAQRSARTRASSNQARVAVHHPGGREEDVLRRIGSCSVSFV
jgi:hypothetical protein